MSALPKISSLAALALAGCCLLTLAAAPVSLPTELSFPDGRVFTETAPADHPWHRGFWFAWKRVNGVNYWGDAKPAEPAGVLPPELTTVSRVTRTATTNGGYRIRAEFDVTALAPATLDRTPPWTNAVGRIGGGYAGLTLRLVPEATNWVRQVTAHAAKVTDPETGHGFVFTDLSPLPTARMYAWPDGRFFNPSPVYLAPVVLEKGERLALRYELEVF